MNKINEFRRRDYRRNPRPVDNRADYAGRITRKLKKKLSAKSSAGKIPSDTVASACSKVGLKPSPFYDAEKLAVKIKGYALHPSMVREGFCMILANHVAEQYEKFLPDAVNKGAALIILSREEFEKSGMNESDYPLALADDPLAVMKTLMAPYRDTYKGKVMGITGSYGKTTTKNYIDFVLREYGMCYVSPANYNSSYDVADNVQKHMTGAYRAFVHESGAAKIGSINVAASILRPDIAIVTNIEGHHLNTYLTMENLTKDKMSLVENLAPGGVAVVNFDNDILANYPYKCRVITYGWKTGRDVDYRIKSAEQQGSELFVVIDTEEGEYELRSNVYGDINAYNIIAAFAVGKEMGIKTEDIIRGIRSYSTYGTRQNMTEHGENKLYVDCYNIGLETALTAMKTLEELELPKGGRRIAVLGGENKLGDNIEARTVEMGHALAKSKVDEIVCYGKAEEDDWTLNKYGDPRTLYRALKEGGFRNLRLILSFDELVDYFEKEIGPQDAVLFKCIIYLNMAAAIDKAFGTGFCLLQKSVKKRATVKKENGYKGFVVPDMDMAYITDAGKAILSSKHAVIPKTFDGKKVFGLAKGLFAYSDIESIDLGEDIRHIGVGAFLGCRKLKEVTIPDSVMYIRAGAFRDCRNLKKVILGKGVVQIDENAFPETTEIIRKNG